MILYYLYINKKNRKQQTYEEKFSTKPTMINGSLFSFLVLFYEALVMISFKIDLKLSLNASECVANVRFN